jgi:lipoyl(octanoyl) transferase
MALVKNINCSDNSVLLNSRQQLGHGDGNPIALDDNLPLCDGAIVSEQDHRIILPGLELDHGTPAHAEQLVHGNDRAAENHRDFDLDAFYVGGHGPIRRTRRDAGANMLSSELTTAGEEAVGAEWLVRPGLLPYPEAVAFMEARAEAIAAGHARELVWLVEHPPIYTAGTSAQETDLLDARFPVFKTGRGGQFTYHGPGQRVAYLMLDLKHRKPDVRAFVRDVEEWLIRALAALGVKGERRPDRVGIWVDRGHGHEDKIAAIGIRIRRWVTFHGVAINVAPDLSHFSGIVPCGVHGHGVTSLADLGIPAGMADVDNALKTAFTQVFGPLAVE